MTRGLNENKWIVLCARLIRRGGSSQKDILSHVLIEGRLGLKKMKRLMLRLGLKQMRRYCLEKMRSLEVTVLRGEGLKMI